MTDERFDELMRMAAQTYNQPPEVAPLDEMWAVIEQKRLHSPRLVDEGDPRPFLSETRRPWLHQPWLRLAAMLLLGLALGRVSLVIVPMNARSADVADQSVLPDPAARPEQAATINYLGETTALLVALPAELRAEQPDSLFRERADDLLLRTRLLLDAPTTGDPALRALLEDLEIVLVQVVRLPARRDPTRVELLRDALEQNDVMPRLRSAVVDQIVETN